ncbi:DUF3014 domain-containing protein [Coralloluteibacterium thermophilus]|uniref:DUF3014 domain-containing protein n=1 Tax=Coralloluteibacterium thermophilum TaxID=2707049 RepID=A0ABV9NR66_9GAMM
MPARRASALPWILTLLVIAGTAGLWWWQTQERSPPAPPPGGTMQEPMPDPSPRHPIESVAVPEAEADAVAPPLDGDAGLLDALRGLVPGEAFGLLVREHLAGRFVATVDNLPNARLAPQIMPVRRVPGTLAIESEADATGDDGVRLLLAEDNAARYTPYVRAFEAADPDRLVALYVRAYPQLQQAYRELGYRDRHFNDRMVAVIDHLLEAPEVAGPIVLRDTGNGYAFADPALEGRSVGHKALLRMGPAHTATVKARLRVLRDRLAGVRPAAVPEEAGRPDAGT